MKPAFELTEVTLIDICTGRGMSDRDIIAAAKAGNCFFTWCDSDEKVPQRLKVTSGQSLR